MSQLKPGHYLANIQEWGIRQSEAGAVSLSLKLECIGLWDPSYLLPDGKTGEFVACDPVTEYADIVMVKKDGTANEAGIRQMCEAGLYKATWAEYEAEPPVTQVVILAGSDTYQNKSTVRTKWVYPATHRPGTGSLRNVADRERLLALDAQFGASVRAVASSIRIPS